MPSNKSHRAKGWEMREAYGDSGDDSTAVDAIADILHTVPRDQVARVLHMAEMHRNEEEGEPDNLRGAVDNLLSFGAKCNAEGEWEHSTLARLLEELKAAREDDCDNCAPEGGQGSCPACWEATGNGCPHGDICENCR